MSGLLAALMAVQPMRAADQGSETDKAMAVAAMKRWLGEIDGAQYARSWQDAAPWFQGKISQANWVAALNNVRKPLGSCNERKLASCALYPSSSPPAGNIPKGDYATAQFETSFANLKYAIETVTFVHGENGPWKATGYYIKPKL
jgi:hypothetical protein